MKESGFIMNGYKLKVKSIQDTNINSEDHIIGKIGGNPTYLPNELKLRT